jgi:2-methylisocitrate lyase-like PEP mutase family enzyme
MNTQTEYARRLHELHQPGSPLVLANVWDAVGARLVATAGAKAVATASASASWTLGVQDGGGLAREDAVALVGRVVRAVELPVTADLEDGYGDTATEVGETVAQVIAVGAVGVNLEDGLRSAAEHAECVAAAKAVADAAGIPIYLNARTDVYLRRIGDPETRLAETLDRARLYLAAGASGIFVPGLADPAVIATLAAELPAPLNVLAGPGLPTVPELAQLGVARVSLGPRPALAAYTALRRAAEELHSAGTYQALADTLSYADLDSLMG